MEASLPKHPVPVFPLQGVFLFPFQVLPLHVFEPRYRQLVGDLLDGPGRFVVATIPSRPLPAVASGPALLPIAGLGEILRHERLPDGRYHIWVLGLCRVEIEEVASDRLYRRVACRPFPEVAATATEAPFLAERLLAATKARVQQPLPLDEAAPPALLADLLVQTLGAPTAMLERYYSEPSVTARAELALAAAATLPPRRRDDDDDDDESAG